ncbi:DUF5316 domain-containing protein [Fictibacillus sp. KIGAM418]|uniref:DUF5316 domain-containing protein n=1 Tax=Fictibacillus marinisediminis TaxID=2878389 RepID=A0A9X1X907_9BACL|nr:DUF5316 domain-containing protein [Fictibacillus marinisediminis]MCK6256417.1 DUF5316 domain-containing protein [Fictibacillus marinisediminis]
MKSFFIAGLIVGAAVLLSAFILNDWSLLLNVSGSIGLVSLLAAGLFTGAFIDGDRFRANYFSETKENRQDRIRYSTLLLLFALPNLIVAVSYYVVQNYL